MSTWNIFQIFLKERDVLIRWSLDQLHKLLYDLVPLVTKGLSSSMFTGGFLCFFTAKQLKIDKDILNLQSCPGSIIPSELDPAYDSLINTSMALLGQHQSSQTHLLGTASQGSSWCGGRGLIPSQPFHLECCRVSGEEMQCVTGHVSVTPPRPCRTDGKKGWGYFLQVPT